MLERVEEREILETVILILKCAHSTHNQQILTHCIKILFLQTTVHDGIQDQIMEKRFEFDLRVRIRQNRTSSFDISRIADKMLSPSTSSRSSCQRDPNSAPFVFRVITFAIYSVTPFAHTPLQDASARCRAAPGWFPPSSRS